MVPMGLKLGRGPGLLEIPPRGARMRSYRIVAPFRPLPLEGGVHKFIEKDFDWLRAVRMLVDSATRACRCPVHVITDVDTTLAVPTLQYATKHRRLMLWTIE